MAYEQKDNSGSLFKNKNKVRANHPDYLGRALVDGKEFEISAWVKTAGPGSKIAGEKYVTLSFRLPQQNGPSRRSAPASYDDFDDDIPF